VAQLPQLSSSLVQKGRAVPADPTDAIAPEPPPPPPAAPTQEPEAVVRTDDLTDDPPLRAPPVRDELRRIVSFRAPIQLDRDLEGMMFETGRTKQELLTEFLAEGIRRWKTERRRGAG
jgi:hypothetical protein